MVIAVIGRGMIGSAAARHLAGAGHQVVLVGPSEPADKASHTGVFGSHYDEGRITRSLDPWPFWSRASRDSIARYAQIEAESGVPFFHEVGLVMAGPDGSGPIARVQAGAARDAILCETLRGDDLAARFGYFRFAPGTLALFEPAGSGYINPRALVVAQGIAAARSGARIVEAEVTGLLEGPDAVVLDTRAGQITADQVLVCAGGYTDNLLAQPLGLTVYARTVVLLEVGPAEVARLAGMPPLIWLEPEGNDPYLLPPIRYPDGRIYLKMGGDAVDVTLENAAAIGAWFRSGGNAQVGQMLEAQVRARMPGVQIEARFVQPCITSFTQDNMAALRRVSARVCVAAAGCGRGAKCSDELGRLGAELALGHDLPAWAQEQPV